MINFVKKGSGKKTIVFLHGWGGSWQSWAPIINKLESKYTIYALDLPGFGLSNLPKPYSLSDYTLELFNFINSKKISNITLVGHSFGGQIAAKFAITYPDKISKLVLVDAALIRNNSLMMKLNISIAKSGKKIIKKIASSLYPNFRKYYYKIRNISMEASDYIKASNDPNLAITLSNIMREDLTNKMSTIKTPTLIFWGEKDHPDYTPLRHALIINKLITNSKLVVAPNASHFSYLDDQELFCKTLEEFI